MHVANAAGGAVFFCDAVVAAVTTSAAEIAAAQCGAAFVPTAVG